MKVRVPVIGTIGKSIVVDSKANEGATIGVDLKLPDGALATVAALRALLASPSASSQTGAVSPTIWSIIREKPANIVQAAALATSGAIVRKSDGSWVTRSVAVADTARLTVANADGDAGDPTLDLATLADSGLGALLAITRDAWGRVSGTRAVIAADIPNLDASKITSGEFPTARIANDAITDAKLRDSAALSVIGRSVNSAGDPADIAAGAALTVLARGNDSTVAFQKASGSMLFNNTITNAKLTDMPESTIKGRVSAGTGDPEDLTATQVAALLSGIEPTWTGNHQWNHNGQPGLAIEVWRDDGGGQADITATTYAVNGGGIFHGRHARGTRAAPTPSQAGDITGGIGSRACHTNGQFHNSSPASIHWQVTENQSGTNFGMWLRLLTTPKGSTTRQERGGVTDNGTFWCHDGGTFDALDDDQTAPTAGSLFVASGSAASGASFVSVAYGSGDPGFRGMRSGGTPASPSETQADTRIAFMGGHGFGETGFSSGTKALLSFWAAENWTDTDQGTYITLDTTPAGSTTRTERVRVGADGMMTIQADTTTPLLVNNVGSDNDDCRLTLQIDGTTVADYGLIGGTLFIRNLFHGGNVDIRGENDSGTTRVFLVGDPDDVSVRLGQSGGKVGFYGTAPVALQTGVAVSAAAIHAALVNLGLITA